MGYKYQKGGTPDFMKSDDSNSTATSDHGLAGGDTTKTNSDDRVKQAYREAQASGDTAKVRRMQDRVNPSVDTVALKQRMEVNSDKIADEFSGNASAKTKAASHKAGVTLTAQNDTLEKARAGKLPVKKP